MDKIVRRIDELGRVVLPQELRKRYGMHKNDAVTFSALADGILLVKHTPACEFCGNDEGLKFHRDKAVCQSCLDTLK